MPIFALAGRLSSAAVTAPAGPSASSQTNSRPFPSTAGAAASSSSDGTTRRTSPSRVSTSAIKRSYGVAWKPAA